VYAEQAVVLVGDDDSLLLELPVAADVIRLLDGRRTAVEIAAELVDVHAPETVHFMLLSLEHAGVIREASAFVLLPDTYGEAGNDTATRALAAQLRTAWAERGDSNSVRISVDRSDTRSTNLILTDDYLSPSLAVNAGSGAILLAGLGHTRIWLGPRILPGQGPCVSCLQDRLRLNLAARSLLHVNENANTESLRVERIDRAVPAAAFDLLAFHILRFIEEASIGIRSHVIQAIRLDGSGIESHAVHRLPQCAACGNPSLATPGADIALASRPRSGRSGGGYRIMDAEETLSRFSSQISALTGVVRHIREVPVEGTDLVHVYTARHALHYGPGTLRTVKAARRDPSGGKGVTDLDARVSALCESLERFSGVHRGHEPCRTARLSELEGDGIEPNALQLYSARQFETRDAWNAADAGGFQWVPEPYADEPIEWSLVRSLHTGQTHLVPSACIYLGFKGAGRRFCKGDSNGLAGGNCIEEAILQGFLELVERDAVTLWWYNRARRPAVALDSFDHPWIERLQDYYRGIGRSVWALDLTTDLGIPCFAALSHTENAARQDIIFGFGCHLDARIALLRALTELNQMLPTVLRPPEERRRQLLPEFRDAIDWWDNATLEDHPYLLPAGAGSSTRQSWATPESTDLRDDVQECVARATAAGCDVLVHDLTRPDIDFAVARVIVPGLRHFWRRLGSGRLYDVPVRLGWLERRLSEGDMNPVSMFV
jgi:ribosomal protein S12 methylthiotransferase accessory factor